MNIPIPPPTQAPVWRRRVAVVAFLTVLSGCIANGDFGEVRSSLVRDDIHDWLSLDATAGQPGFPSSFEVTDDERQLRDLAYPLIEAPYNRQQWYSIAGNME